MSPKKTFYQTTRSIVYYTLLVCTILGAVYILPKSLSSIFKPSDKSFVFNDSRSFAFFLDEKKSSLTQIRKTGSILNVQTLNLPTDLARYPADKRTSLFITLVLSHAVTSNEIILNQRKKLIQFIHDRDHSKYISPQRQNWFETLAKTYKQPEASPEQLLEYVDIIPVSMTIAQAITESGWGTSRFAQQGNALYGQHLPTNSSGKYITSLYGDVKVAAFDSLYQCTQNYIRNLNTSKAYAQLRNIRKMIRDQGRVPDGHALAAGLLHYSEIGEDYIRDIRFLIGKYELSGLEGVTLNKESPPLVVRFDRKSSLPPTAALQDMQDMQEEKTSLAQQNSKKQVEINNTASETL
ncbi:MAG: glucosaminidase domain-containing protein [Desulfocapsaceae bacterium]|nr:glucosaminidase domain-containing protein [Desulfocapsaceae bacterium]